jgi:hypothetical protein
LLTLIEFLRLHRPGGFESELMLIFYLDVLAVHFNIRLALVDANEIVVRVKIVQASFGKSNHRAVFRDDNIVFGVQLGQLHGSFASVQPQFRVGQAGRNHHCRAVVAESKKDARGQEKLRFACLRF